jgi:prepilin-type N-terminal cleavage/methylation domain-containing protein
MRNRMNGRGFSLIELVIVVVIIAIIGAIAIPRMSRGAAGAADSALTGNLSVLRSAVDLYQTEHGGTFPTAAAIEAQLTQYSDALGATNQAKGGAFIYGPYIRKVPPLPVGARKGQTGVGTADGPTIGWIYEEANGNVKANTTASEKDDSGKLYSDY